MLAGNAQTNLVLYETDVKTAFLNQDLGKRNFMEVLDGVRTGTNQNVICKFNKFLNGTKQAPRCWDLIVNEVLCKELGFKITVGNLFLCYKITF